jgi:hypothetical protein
MNHWNITNSQSFLIIKIGSRGFSLKPNHRMGCRLFYQGFDLVGLNQPKKYGYVLTTFMLGLQWLQDLYVR